MLVEIFCGILADADYGPNIRKWRNTDRIANLVSDTDSVLKVLHKVYMYAHSHGTEDICVGPIIIM